MPLNSFRKLAAFSALLTLIFAVWGGLLRLQWRLPVLQANWISYHGPLMVNGFFGTVIGLARANILRSKAGLLVPFSTVVGSWILLLGGTQSPGAGFFLAASLGYLLVCAGFFRRQPPYSAGLALLGGLGWAWANFFWWRGEPIPHLMAGWQALFILTISSERLEAIRWQPIRFQALTLWTAVALICTGVAAQPFLPSLGLRILSAGYLTLAARLLASDQGWNSLKSPGWRGYSKACVLSAYSWLFVAACVGLASAPLDSDFSYDAFLHCVFLGLVFSMVFSHAPLLLPRVLNTSLPFHPLFYVHWILLQASLLARVGGDLLQSTPWRRWGALLNALALLIFILTTVSAVIRGKKPA